MHELSLTQNIIKLVLKNAGEKRVVRVNLLMGQFSDEREDSIRFYWEDFAKNTPAQGAELYFARADAEMKCLDCGEVFHPAEELSSCPRCYRHRLQLLSGDDVKLDSIDVE